MTTLRGARATGALYRGALDGGAGGWNLALVPVVASPMDFEVRPVVAMCS